MNAPHPSMSRKKRFGKRTRRLVLAFAEAILPGGEGAPGADERVVELLEEYLARKGMEPLMPVVGAALSALDATALAFYRRRFVKLSRSEQQEHLTRLASTRATQIPIHLLSALLKLLHFDQTPVLEALGGERVKVLPEAPPSWKQNVVSASSWDPNETIECDVVVVGTGAGGGVVGAELAERGHAVLFVEEGEYYDRSTFLHSQVESFERYYHNGVWVFGNNVFPIFSGRMVGGSTAVNTGTSLRPPRFIIDAWAERLKSSDFSAEGLEPYFHRVEQRLGVTTHDPKHIGPIGDVIARGCDALGWSHYALPRNAPDCTGEGFCAYGCRTGAKRSTDVSYVPAALKNGAMLLTGMRADEVIVENARAVGLRGFAKSDGRRIEVRAKKVVIAGNAVNTPLMLMKQGLCNQSGQLGRNLTLHPSTGLSALYDEVIDGTHHIPQGYGTQEFIDEGILINAANADPTVFPIILALTGAPLMKAVAQQDRMVGLGILAHDHGEGGRVWWSAKGHPLITYNLTPQDVHCLHQGLVRGTQMLTAAGAKKVYPGMMNMPVLEGPDDVQRLIDADPKPGDFILISYHPLGTAKMGRDPKSSVVDLWQESHDVKDLHIVDGSSIPGAPAVNPQITIMAFATRAAERIHDAL
jgi:choline dehydrogenase-like flavoprotein